ncbi:O-antigen ligase family protein [Planktothrix pseudagardhii]|uniref:O-antigen polymerase n=1 Tax=Planktothrix pseudagardhii TaxID=132604 RepID=A0A9W4DDK5_9CYAN|nr:O-antigen ligase family protein [Planktothrix pseudagardhii]CAD5982307.1 O-antigen polymerase [Planktothrix pseudagardhii]
MKFILFPHPEQRLQLPWNCLQWGVFLFPLLPTFGGIAIILGSLLCWKRQFKSIQRNPINQGLAILSILLIIISILANNLLESFLGLSNFIPYFIVFAGLSEMIQTANQLRWLSGLMIISAVPVGILGLGQQYLGWSGIDLLQGILGWSLHLNGNPPGRMSSVFMYANIFAAYLVIIFTLTLGLLIEEWQNKAQTSIFPIHNSKLRITLLVFTLLLTGIDLILTNSRNAWGLAVLSSLAYALYLGWWWLILLVSTGVTAVLGSAFAPSPLRAGLRIIIPAYFWQRITDQNFVRPVETLRITQWKFTLNLTQTRPFSGWGLRNFTPLYEAKMNVWLGHPHNLFLMMFAEMGIPTTLFFMLIVGVILTQGFLVLKNTLINPSDRLIYYSYLITFLALILFNCFDVSLFDFRVNTYGWLILSGIWGVACTIPKTNPYKILS